MIVIGLIRREIIKYVHGHGQGYRSSVQPISSLHNQIFSLTIMSQLIFVVLSTLNIYYIIHY